jgi:hypothetical protein
MQTKQVCDTGWEKYFLWISCHSDTPDILSLGKLSQSVNGLTQGCFGSTFTAFSSPP